jgi:hypothetical protein
MPAKIRGALTWGAEGQEGGMFHSRKLHVPGQSSGLTVGRGYDMKERTQFEVKRDLILAGMKEADAGKISKAAGLQGDKATKFVKDNKLETMEISHDVQDALFELTYAEQEGEVKRISTKADVVELYGMTNWPQTHPAIKTILVDLKYRGDYTPASRRFLQKAAADNDLETMTRIISDRDNWQNVPKDRFERRKKFMEEALKEKGRKDMIDPGQTKPFTPRGPSSKFGNYA